MTEWIRLCRIQELPPEGHAKEFSAGGRTFCVAKLNGQALALDNVCPHRGGPLGQGTVENGKIVCPWHQWEFDLVTGSSSYSQQPNVAVYPLRQEEDAVPVECSAG